MADKTTKNKDNIDGEYYVDDQCMACNACIIEAPDFFQMNDEECYAFVCKQPSTPTDREFCEKAVDSIPDQQQFTLRGA